ncbi:MAG TPA: DUF4440 domain-containing protein [Pyrinomonadaceae bacterium]|nr:DUF4440 domain-containing protein [Pyrinomonadaceae bacterium]
MNRPLLFLSVIVLSLAINGQSDVERQLRALNAQYDAAIVANNVSSLNRIFADDFVYTSPEGEVRNKAQQLEIARSGLLKLDFGKSDDVVVRVYGNSAVMTGRFTAKGTFRGEALEIRERYTAVWVKQKGRWRLASEQGNFIRQPNSAAADDVARTGGLDFSRAVVRASASGWAEKEVAELTAIYTNDAILFPPKGDPIKGSDAVRRYWTRPSPNRILQHDVKTEWAQMSGDLLVEHGHFTLTHQTVNNRAASGSAKFICVWKRGVDGIGRKSLDSWW